MIALQLRASAAAAVPLLVQYDGGGGRAPACRGCQGRKVLRSKRHTQHTTPGRHHHHHHHHCCRERKPEQQALRGQAKATAAACKSERRLRCCNHRRQQLLLMKQAAAAAADINDDSCCSCNHERRLLQQGRVAAHKKGEGGCICESIGDEHPGHLLRRDAVLQP